MSTITSANAVVMLAVAGLFPVPVQIQGFSAEKAWDTNPVVVTESQMGVDGRKTSGWVPNMVEQSYSLQADSPSKQFFNAIQRAQVATRDAYYITGSITLPSTGEAFTLTKGTLKNFPSLPNGGKVLGPMDFSIEWESIQPTLI